MSNEGEKEASYEDYWGKLARPLQACMPPRCSIAVPLRFYRGPLARAIQTVEGDATRAGVKAFLHEAVKAWYDRYKDRTAKAAPERVRTLFCLVPTPGKGEASTRLDVNLEGQVRPEAFGRVVETRFTATRAGAGMALREAILEALDDVRSQAEADKASSDD